VKVDLLRQLDEWGTHLEARIEHVDVDELFRDASEMANEAEARSQPVWYERWNWRTPIRVAGVAAVVIALAIPVVRFMGEGVSSEFSSVSGVIGDADFFSSSRQPLPSTPASGVATTLPPTTQAPTTTAAPTTTRSPDVTTAPGGTVPPAGNNPANLGRDVIFTGDLAIDTRDVSGAVVAARAIVESSGGYVFGQELGGESTVMSLKVPSEFFQDTVDRLSELGTVRNARVTSQDVTERIVDLESQISTAEASVARLRDLIAEAATIDSIAQIESELLQRETNLEQLRGRLRTMEDQVALSTIVLTLREFSPSSELQMFVTVHRLGDGVGEECYTNPQTGIPPGEDYVVCLDITNVGNVPLTDLEISGQDAIVGSLTPVRGQRLTTLPAGQRYVLWATSAPVERDREPITVRAIPIGDDGERAVEETIEVERLLSVTIREEPDPEPDGLPSLSDALSAGWDVLATGTNALAVAVAFFLPLLWIPLVAGLFVWWRRRRS
jgi:hypothetical protein